jgi:hypothetical protein
MFDYAVKEWKITKFLMIMKVEENIKCKLTHQDAAFWSSLGENQVAEHFQQN